MSKKLFAALTMVAAIALTLPLIGRTKTVIPSRPSDATSLETQHVEEATSISNEDGPCVVSLQVTPSGFEPGETVVPRGKVLILLQNRSGNRDLRFYLVRENQERLVESEPQRRDWKVQVELGPGTYIVGETSHSEWKSVIRVTN